MDELQGPNIQIVLRVKEGLGFGFLHSPFLVSGSLNGYLLETDPAPPCHAPAFDAELVWETDKRRFRNLRVQNVPVKIEVYTIGTKGKKQKIGYLLLSLLGAQPCPSNKSVIPKHTWHRLLGVKTEGKCCHPQLMLGLTIEDRANTITPRNELKIFHSNEATSYLPMSGNASIRSLSCTVEDLLAESNKMVSSLDLTPRLLVDEGLIQIGSAGSHLFILSFVLGAAENVDMLLPEKESEATDCFVTYSVFTHTIQTERVATMAGGLRKSTLQFNQRTSLRLCTDLASLSRYFAECPQVVTRLCSNEQDIGICSTDLRKLVPTEDVAAFVESFCDAERTLTVAERCALLACGAGARARSARRPFVHVETSLKYVGARADIRPPRAVPLAARSASHLGCAGIGGGGEAVSTLEMHKSRSCTEVDRELVGVTYTNITARNTTRYINANGDAAVEGHNEVAEMIRKMYETFTNSQEKLLNSMARPVTSDCQVQCEHSPKDETPRDQPQDDREDEEVCVQTARRNTETQTNSKETPEKESINSLLPAEDRETLMKKCVEELEDWKEQQQQLFKIQLTQKEEYHLEMLSAEWSKRREELESKLSRGIEQCRNLAADLSRATEDFRLRGYRNTQREQKLLQAKQSLEQHYTGKLQELREASQKMEVDMGHEVRLKDMRIEELEARVEQLQKETETLKNNMVNLEKNVEQKKSGLTKDQTASLIQELRAFEEKLEDAIQSKAFFKEQWGRAVRELHTLKLQDRRRMLTRLQRQRRHLGDAGVDDFAEDEVGGINNDKVDHQNRTDEFYVNLLANTPVVTDSITSAYPFVDVLESAGEGMHMPKKVTNEKLNHLIEQRDRLIQKENPDEQQLLQLNHEIRNLLLSCGT